MVLRDQFKVGRLCYLRKSLYLDDIGTIKPQFVIILEHVFGTMPDSVGPTCGLQYKVYLQTNMRECILFANEMVVVDKSPFRSRRDKQKT